MTVDVMKLYEEANRNGKTGISKKVAEKIGIIKDALVENGINEVPVATLRKMVEMMLKEDLPEEDQASFKLDYSTVRSVVESKFKLANKMCVF